jgi:hypothetical protein
MKRPSLKRPSFKSLSHYFFKDEGDKKTLDLKRVTYFVLLLFCLGILVMLATKSDQDSSTIQHSSEPINTTEGDHSGVKGTLSEKVKEMFSNSEGQGSSDKRQSRSKRARYVKNVEFKAVQVIRRKGPDGFSRGLPLGTNLVGKLLTAIDTREAKQLYKVILPYGGKDKNGGSIPKNTILFGTINYPNRGKKIFIQFTKALLPDGKEVKMNAQALNAKSYSPGINGDYHGKAAERIAATLGLTMISAGAETLTEREALGGSPAGGNIISQATPKATLKNALYQGVSKVSEMEASRQMNELGKQPEYVTVPAGKEMIVNLLSTYRTD